MRAGSLRAFMAVVPLIGALSGCATTRELDVWISQSEPRTWAAHSIEVSGATLATDIIADRPWWGYAFMMGAQVGWEVQEARLTDWDVPWWGTAMDLLAPAVTGFVVAKLLNRGNARYGGAEPVFPGVQPIRENGGDAEADADGGVSSTANRAVIGSASRLLVVHLTPFSSEPCGPTPRDWPRPGRAPSFPGSFARCTTPWELTQP